MAAGTEVGAPGRSWGRRTAVLGLASSVLAVPLLVVFGPLLFHDRQLAFQDAGHFYYPLLQRVQQEWDAGRWPLWTPEASAGMPLLGSPTAAVLYPGKLVFFWLPLPWAVRVYTVAHVALAFVAMGLMLRSWGVSATGALLGALAYAFGVPVLSETSNQIFLVGAAWAPLGFLAADRWVRGGRRLALPGLACVLALQVLGGDPEAAYLTLACAGGYAAGLALVRSPQRLRRRLLWGAAGLALAYLGLLGLSWWLAYVIHRVANATPATPPPWTPPTTALVSAAWLGIAAVVVWKAWGRSRARGGGEEGKGQGADAPRSPGAGNDASRFAVAAAGLLAAAALGLAIAGAQLLPIVEYASTSFRAAAAEGFHDIYPYSAHPLQLLDALWPSVFGTLEGGYRSWLNALPPKPESRLWMPSLYLGGLTLVLAAVGAGAGWREGSAWRVWLTFVAVLSLLAALGYYTSPLLWARCVPGWESVLGPIEAPFSWQIRNDGKLRDGDGGVYWFLATALPGFRSFRYPPKLFILWALAVSGLAGAGWDRLAGGKSGRRAGVVAGCLLGLSAVALAASWIGAVPLRGWFERLAESLRTSDEPLNPAKALADLRAGIGYGCVALAFALGVALFAPRRPGLIGPLAVAGLMLDLIAANAYHVVTVPQEAFEGTPLALKVIEEAERAKPSDGPYRVQRVGAWWPLGWSETAAPRRFEEITRWERMTLRPHYNLPLGVCSTFYFDTVESVDYGLFFLPWSLLPDVVAVRAHDLKPEQRVWYYPRRGFDLWNTRYFIVPGRMIWESTVRGYASLIPNSTFLYPPIGSFDGPGGKERRSKWEATQDFRVLRNEVAYPRAWVVHRAYLLPPIRGLRVADRVPINLNLLYQADEFWTLAGLPVRDPRSVAWVETDHPKEVDRLLSRADPDPSETVSVIVNEPQRVELSATLFTSGLVVVADMFYPGWTLTVDGRPAEILRTNRAMRGVALPAGTHRLVFRYQPWSFRLGLALSTVGLIILAALVAWAVLGNGGPTAKAPESGPTAKAPRTPRPEREER